MRSANSCQRDHNTPKSVYFCLDDKTNLDLFIVVKLQFSQKKKCHLLIPWTCMNLVHQFKSWRVGKGNKKVINNLSPFFKLKISVWYTVIEGYLKPWVQRKWYRKTSILVFSSLSSSNIILHVSYLFLCFHEEKIPLLWQDIDPVTFQPEGEGS